MKKKMKKIVVLCLVVTMLIGSTITVNAEEYHSVATFAKTTTEITTEEEEITSQQVIEVEKQKNPSVFIGENFEVSFYVTSKRNSTFDANITITNTSDTVIDNWAVQFDMPYEITNIWNGVIDAKESGTYIIKNLGYNQDINVGSSISFGISANATEKKLIYPVEYKLLGRCIQSTFDTYEIGFKVKNDWEAAINGEIQIKNISEEPIEDWQLEFDFDNNITRFWEADIVVHEGNHYVIKNRGYNANIQSGKKLVLGFNGNSGNKEIVPEHYVLTYVGREIDYEKDTDGDDLPDYYEKVLGTSINDADTDDDKLSDYIEMVTLNTDPTKKDTNDNGIYDGDEDLDFDALTNLEEVEFGLNPLNEDTDFDGLIDGKEVNTYETDPLDEDTDDDTILDGDEILIHLDPTIQDTDSDGVLDSNEKIQQTKIVKVIEEEKPEITNVSIKMAGTGYIENTTTIESVYETDTLSSDVAGLIGVPVEINSKSQFDEAIITFTYDDILLDETKEEDLAILWYDEENNWYEIFDENSIIDKENNTVSCTTTHFSTYMVVDKVAWYKVWASSMNLYDSDGKGSKAYTPYYLSFVVDDSGSMSWNGRVQTAKEALKGFINHITEEDKANLIKFTYSATKLCNFTNDKQTLLSCVDKLYANGGTSVYSGLNLSISDFKKFGSDKEKTIVLLCDGDVNVRANNSLITDAKDMNIKIYPVLIGNGSSRSDERLQGIADATGGKYFKAQTTEEIIDCFYGIQGETIAELDNTDTDGDGVYDICENTGMMLPNGKVITTDSSNPDTDGDGLTDGEEMGELKLIKDQAFLNRLNSPKEGISKCCRYFNNTSNPKLKDTDYDGIVDDKDKDQNNNKFEGMMYYEINNKFVSSNVEFAVDYRKLFKNNKSYSKDLSVLTSLFASDIYDNKYIKVTKGAEGGSDNCTEFGSIFGLSDIEDIKVGYSIKNGEYQYTYTKDKDDVTEFVIGHRLVNYNGEDREVIILSVRGTNGTNAEWSSNFDVGADTSKYYEATGDYHPDWKNKKDHKGFSVAANRILVEFNEYLKRHGLNGNSKKSILITGHSRGAAIANILGASFENDSKFTSYTYTFAAPNPTTDPNVSNYKTIFNIINKDDIIPCLPLDDWGFTKYGVTKSISVEDHYENHWGKRQEGTWEWLVGKDYNNDGGTDRTLDRFSKIADNRQKLYILDSSKDGKVNESNKYHITRKGAKEELANLTKLLSKEKLLKYCNVRVIGGGFLTPYHVELNYCPAYLMQTLANMTTGVGPMLGRDVKGKYQDAKVSFVASSGKVVVGGMEDPHTPITYYLIAHNNFVDKV